MLPPQRRRGVETAEGNWARVVSSGRYEVLAQTYLTDLRIRYAVRAAPCEVRLRLAVARRKARDYMNAELHKWQSER